MRRMKKWLVMVVLPLAAGCCGDRESRVSRCEDRPAACWYVEAPCRPSPTLLFDRVQPPLQPGRPPITAQDFACRSDWPSTPGYYSTGEAVFYRTWYYDNQGDGYNNFDYMTRQFQSYTYGAKFR